ncbi:hypothetical protein Defa_27030 [Desulfovibrio sp. TH_2024_36128]|uniref:Uncharacterized protein n=1 Tax=Desulfovibrio falkowii TaxID=3136602 RepID=A0ABQ0EC84_9BACT
MYLAHLAVPFVDGADLGLKHEKRLFGTAVAHMPAGHDIKLFRLSFEAVQAAGFVQLKLL